MNSGTKRQESIAQRLAQMPRQYQAIYRKAVSGRSRKAAMHSFCVECCGYRYIGRCPFHTESTEKFEQRKRKMIEDVLRPKDP